MIDCGQQSCIRSFEYIDVISVLDEVLIDGVDIRSIFERRRVHVTDSLLTHHQIVVE